MATKNFFIAYDLLKPGQQYDRMEEGIKKVCTWYMKLQYSLYYIRSEYTASEIYDTLRSYQDANDKLAVIQASNAVVSSLSDAQRQVFLNLWNHGTPTPANAA